MCKNNMCEKVFNSENMGFDLSKSIDGIINSYLEKGLLRECISCEETDILKVCCFECEVFLCNFCFDELKNNEDDLGSYDIFYNNDMGKYGCLCEVEYCRNCEEYRNDIWFKSCNDCNDVFCCGLIDSGDTMICYDCSKLRI